MVNPLSVLTTIPTEAWFEATWDEFLTFADDPTLVSSKFYYERGYMRIETNSIGSARGHDITILSTLINLYATVKGISIRGLTHTRFRKLGIRESQPSLAFYLGDRIKFPPHHHTPVDLNNFDPPTLVVETIDLSLETEYDGAMRRLESDRKQKLYQQMGVKEYWAIVNVNQIIAVALSPEQATQINESQVLPGLDISLIEKSLRRAQTEDDGAVNRWFLAKLDSTLSQAG